MTIRKRQLTAAGAALAAAVAVAACGSSAAPQGTPGSTAPQPTAATATTRVNAADVAFTAGMLRLEDQAAAAAALVPARTATAQVRRYAASLEEHAAEYQQMRGMMGQWGHLAPEPYTPGATPPAGTGPGMMGPRGWDEMTRLHGSDFNGHFADMMIANRAAEVALCRAELSRGASAQARALARTMLTQRQAELSQLRAWHHQWDHGTGGTMMGG